MTTPQSSGEVDATIPADVFDIDLFDVPDGTMAALKASGRRIVCYFSGGTYEDWRADWAGLQGSLSNSAFQSLLGAPLADWPGERWLNLHDSAAVELIKSRIMAPRIALARSRGCDAVEPDNVDGYTTANGVGITSSDQLAYNRWLAQEAHAQGLAVGLKNDLNQVAALAADFDFAVNEQCFQYGECDLLTPFLSTGKAVFGVEYAGQTSQVGVPRTVRSLIYLEACNSPCMQFVAWW